MIDLNTLTAEQLAKCFDHTLLKADAVEADFVKLCDEAKEYGFYSVMVNPSRVALCKKLLEGTDIKIGTVIGFPLGATTIADKVTETRRAIEAGADEIDYVLNVGMLREGNLEYIQQEMLEIVAACRMRKAGCKVILETCYLTDEEITAACETAAFYLPDFVKTSTGFGTGGATPEHVALMAKKASKKVKVKASGGIRTWADCKAMLEAGAERIGASAGVKILQEFNQQ